MVTSHPWQYVYFNNFAGDNLEKKYAFMFFYQTKDKLSYQEIHEKTQQLFEKFLTVHQLEK
jgi:ribonuclease P protein component